MACVGGPCINRTVVKELENIGVSFRRTLIHLNFPTWGVRILIRPNLVWKKKHPNPQTTVPPGVAGSQRSRRPAEAPAGAGAKIAQKWVVVHVSVYPFWGCGRKLPFYTRVVEVISVIYPFLSVRKMIKLSRGTAISVNQGQNARHG